MILTRHPALKAALLSSAMAITAAFGSPAQAEHRYGGGNYIEFSSNWHARGHAHAHAGRGFVRDYGWYAPGQYYNPVDHRPLRSAHDRGREWCPTRRAYIVYQDADPEYDDGDFYDVWDDSDNWPDEYYERDRQYRRW